MSDTCDWKRCKLFATIGYMGNRGMCDKHFAEFCDAQDRGKEDWAREKIRLAPRKKVPKEANPTECTSSEVSDTMVNSFPEKIEKEETGVLEIQKTVPVRRKKRKKRKY